MHEEYESFIRWQELTLNHFSSVINLILTLATGLLAFQSSLLLERHFYSYYAFLFTIISLGTLITSIALGLWCTVNRLIDFRLTARISRQKDGISKIQELRDKSKVFGKVTWCLFWGQMIFFLTGASCGVFAVIIQVWIY